MPKLDVDQKCAAVFTCLGLVLVSVFFASIVKVSAVLGVLVFLCGLWVSAAGLLTGLVWATDYIVAEFWS